jgi:hypothetical protein
MAWQPVSYADRFACSSQYCKVSACQICVMVHGTMVQRPACGLTVALPVSSHQLNAGMLEYATLAGEFM